jgi:hypothetical protein
VAALLGWAVASQFRWLPVHRMTWGFRPSSHDADREVCLTNCFIPSDIVLLHNADCGDRSNDAHLGAAFSHYFDAASSRWSMTKRMRVTASTPAGTQIACNPHTRVVNAPAIAPAANVPITPA